MVFTYLYDSGSMDWFVDRLILSFVDTANAWLIVTVTVRWIGFSLFVRPTLKTKGISLEKLHFCKIAPRFFKNG